MAATRSSYVSRPSPTDKLAGSLTDKIKFHGRVRRWLRGPRHASDQRINWDGRELAGPMPIEPNQLGSSRLRDTRPLQRTRSVLQSATVLLSGDWSSS